MGPTKQLKAKLIDRDNGRMTLSEAANEQEAVEENPLDALSQEPIGTTCWRSCARASSEEREEVSGYVERGVMMR
jgi:hypothetical protein